MARQRARSTSSNARADKRAQSPRARRHPWRRFLIALIATSTIAFGALTLFFLSTDCWNSRRSLPLAIDDFFFALRTLAAEQFRGNVPPFSDENYDTVMSHLEDEVDSSVRSAARWHLQEWGAHAAPRLVQELSGHAGRSRRLAAIEILGAHRVRAAIPPVIERLRSTTSSLERERILDFLDTLRAPSALPALVELAESIPHDDRDYARALESIAHTSVGSDYLLSLVKSTPLPRPEVFSALILSGDHRGVEFVATYLDHPDYWIRRGAAFALSNSTAAVPLLLTHLASERDDFQRELLIDPGLNSPTVANVRVAAQRVGALTQDPVVGVAAVKTLAAHDTAWAIAELWKCQTWQDPSDVIGRLDAATTYGPSLLEALLRHPRPNVRSGAILSLGEIHSPICTALIQRAAYRDPDKKVRAVARRELLTQDKFRLHASMRRFQGLPEKRWDDWNPPLGDLPRFVRGLHFIACAFAALLACALICGWVKPFEPDRFRFFVAFFLVEGLLGNFIVFDDSVAAFRVAVGIHTLLLTGFLVQDRAFVRRRFERLAGASLWALIPCTMYWGTPVVADALRTAAGEFSFFLALVLLLLLGVVAALPVFVSWLHIPVWLKRGIVSGVLSAFLVLFGIALTYFSKVAWRHGAEADTVIAALLLVPLTLKLFGLLSDAHRDRKATTPKMPSSSQGRLRLFDVGPTTTLRLPRGRTWSAVILVLLGAALLVGLGSTVAEGSLRSWGSGRLVLTFVCGAVGALLVTAGACALFCRHVVQVRDGLVRHGVALYGVVVSRTSWRRSPPYDLELTTEEKRFLRQLISNSVPHTTPPHQRTVAGTVV